MCVCECVYVCLGHVFVHLRTKRGYKCATYDWQQSKRCMDFNSAAGFLLLSSIGNGGCNKPCMPAVSSAFSRLALYVVFNMGPDSVMMAGPDCSSWGIPARGSSKRSYINPMGLESVPFVASANCMIGRFLGIQCLWIRSSCMRALVQRSNPKVGGPLLGDACKPHNFYHRTASLEPHAPPP